ncbi:conserved hypothetical protein [Ricinus communis]|uniref:Uncharacterized protein n=1 Tax=Ricinus communis TaxID=3988 RepID=B9RQP4_RICCO|nr:conserved hypothetical protein [Ricinus communis]
MPQSPKDVVVADVWRRGNWALPDALDDTTLEAWKIIIIKTNFRVDLDDLDQVKLKLSKYGKFCISSVSLEVLIEGSRGNEVGEDGIGCT